MTELKRPKPEWESPFIHGKLYKADEMDSFLSQIIEIIEMRWDYVPKEIVINFFKFKGFDYDDKISAKDNMLNCANGWEEDKARFIAYLLKK